jgi:hypothetical protein
MTDNRIPVADVTNEPTHDEVHAQSREHVETVLNNRHDYLMIAFSGEGEGVLNVIAACSEGQLDAFAVALVQMLGMDVMGPERVQAIPPQMVAAVATATGLKRLNDVVRIQAEQAAQAMQPAQTPAGDVGQQV